MTHLAIIGNGAWGSALTIALASKVDNIALIGKSIPKQLKTTNTHPVLGLPYPDNVILYDNYTAIHSNTIVLIAVPSSSFQEVLESLSEFEVRSIAWATKGLLKEHYLHSLFTSFFPHHPPCVISGPSFATEVAQKQPTALVVASTDNAQREYWAQICTTSFIKPYISDDVLGVELGGALKNIYAIATGIVAGLGFGTNAISALITRSLAEMTRFGVVMGANKDTFTGLSGMGDLILTCLDDVSRNRSFGKYIAKGLSTNEALKKVNATVEGLYTLEVVITLAKKHHIPMPICEQIHKVLNESIEVKDAVIELLSRDIRHE